MLYVQFQKTRWMTCWHTSTWCTKVSSSHAKGETNTSIPFLDVKVTRQQDGSLSTCTYRKPTHTDQYLHFSSHHPRAHKSSVVTTLLRRAFTHCSTEEERKSELAHIHKALTINGYPCRFVNSRLPEAKRRTEPRENNPNSFACIPYIQGVSEAISRVLAEIDIHTYFKPVNTIRSMVSHPKDRVPLLSKSGVVYKVECGCCNASYVGETKRRLESRLAEHRKAVQKGEVNASALAEHVWNVGHHVNWDSMKVLSVSGRHYSRLALEAIHIRRQKNSLNRDRGKLGTAYDFVI